MLTMMHVKPNFSQTVSSLTNGILTFPLLFARSGWLYELEVAACGACGNGAIFLRNHFSVNGREVRTG